MRIPEGCHTRIVRYPSGKKYKLILDGAGRIIESVRMPDLYRKTRTSRRLNRKRRRLGL